MFGLEKFYHYVWGHRAMIQTDHKPSEAIALKNLDSPEWSIKFKDMIIPSSTDSRLLIQSIATTNEIEGIGLNIHALNAQLNASQTRLQRIRDHD